MAVAPKDKKTADLEAGAKKDAVTVPTEETDAGGAQVETVEVVTFEPPADEEHTMEIVTTDLGVLGLGGIAGVGTEATINCRHFAIEWMQPKRKKDVEALKAYRASVKKDATA